MTDELRYTPESWSSSESTTCRFIRPFKNYLIAGDITEGGIRKPRLLWWSHAADTGNVPQSWDYTGYGIDYEMAGERG